MAASLEGYDAFYRRVGPTAIPVEVTRTTWSRFFDHYEPVSTVWLPNMADDLSGWFIIFFIAVQ